MLLLLLACSGLAAPAPAPPAADTPAATSPAAVPPAAPAVGAFPPELVGTWVRLTAREGRWVVHQPCGEVLPRLSIPAGDGPVRFEVGQDEWTGSPVSLAPSADG